MARQRSVRIDDDLDRFIEERVGSRDYRSADEVVAAGLRLLRKEAADLDEVSAWFAQQDVRPLTMEELRDAIRAGEESGPAQEVDFNQMFEDVQAELEIERAKRR